MPAGTRALSPGMPCSTSNLWIAQESTIANLCCHAITARWPPPAPAAIPLQGQVTTPPRERLQLSLARPIDQAASCSWRASTTPAAPSAREAPCGRTAHQGTTRDGGWHLLGRLTAPPGLDCDVAARLSTHVSPPEVTALAPLRRAQACQEPPGLSPKGRYSGRYRSMRLRACRYCPPDNYKLFASGAEYPQEPT